MIKKSSFLNAVHSDIRGPLYREALRMEAEGTPVLKLNTGNPGRFGFKMPDSVRNALEANMDEAVPYCDVRGMQAARSAISLYHQSRGLRDVEPNDIFICNGVSEAASMLMTALCEPGDEVLLPCPCYSLWSNTARISGCTTVFYRCSPEDAWQPDVCDIRSKVTPRTKAILLINPNNPTGAVYSRKVLLEIAEIAREKHLLLISDEIYDRLVMDGIRYESIAALAPDVPCVTLNGLSKSHIVCGFRCGWMVFSGSREELEELRAAVMELASMRLCGNALTQLVVPAAMNDPQSTRDMIVPGGMIYERREATQRALANVPGVNFVPCRAAFYLFPGLDAKCFDFADAQDFAMRFLHEEHILVIPGTGFEYTEEIRFRIVMLPDPDTLTRAMNSLIRFLDRYRI